MAPQEYGSTEYRTVAPSADGWPKGDPPEVVECGGLLWDHIGGYVPHRFPFPEPNECSPYLARFLAAWWGQHDEDVSGGWTAQGSRRKWRSEPAHRDERKLIASVAAEAAGSAATKAIERRRAFRVLDYALRTEAPALLDLARFKEHAARFRALPEIVTLDVPLVVRRTLNAAYRETDKASTAALRSRGPYRRVTRPRSGPYVGVATLLDAFAPAVPGMSEAIEEGEPHALARGLTAGIGFASICATRDTRVSAPEAKRVAAERRAGVLALVREVISMRAGRPS